MSDSTGRTVASAGTALTGAGAAVAAAAASACCVGPVVAPLVVGVLGASGAVWAAGLKPYTPYILAGSLLLLGYGFWSAYGRPMAGGAADGETCGSARSPLWVRIILWVAAALWLASLGVNLFLASP